ncbi:hypothetical protein [Thermoactinomyces sp. DSM 45892]|uniref:hypothetical protein n=1 Tax=Thermoactinomyces sp. DSM 45892 TaxID=1882753 RepID=UPI0008964B67|nr:hypothetical protein [Thermoactinomyces sp. DSM 45892]SDY85665.1 hypothetical protein SAMN05444416_10987 [Thermoactinomyces sp. DSM 45892]
MYFKNARHERLFHTIVGGFEDWQQMDRECLSCAYAFSATEKTEIKSFFDKKGIEVEKLKKASHLSGRLLKWL